MTYDLVYTERVLKQLKKLDKLTQERIVNTLERCRVRPYNYIKKLVGIPYFRLRVGDLRIIVDIKDDKLCIMILEINHRRKIYKK